jgi:hypothetical protein
MNYLEWNNAIIKHFFNPEYEDKEVMLYFSEGIIEEIGSNYFTKPAEGYLEDFYKSLRVGVNGVSNENYIDRILKLEEKYRSGCKKIAGIEFNYPPYFTYILTFILPFTSQNENEDCNINNFHDVVKDFFEKKKLTTNYDKIVRKHLTEIEDLWTKINQWLIEENNFYFGYLEEIKPPKIRRFVGKFEYHILFRKKQEELLSAIFDRNDILPGEVISETVIRKLLLDNYSQLKLSISTKNKIADKKDYIGNKIVKRALTFYDSWTGSNFTTDGVRGFSRNRLVLCIDFNKINNKIQLKYFRIYLKQRISDDIKLTDLNGILIQNVFQVNQNYSSPINGCFVDLKTNVLLTDNSNRYKYSWKSKEFYLFKRISQFDWVEIPKVEFNVKPTLIICKKSYFENNLKNWFEAINSNKCIYDNNTKTELPSDWLALTIETITNHPHSIVPELIPLSDLLPKINYDKSFYYDGKLFKDKLPIVWLENTEIIEPIFAMYEDGTRIPLKQISHVNGAEIEVLNQFIFTDEHLKSDKLNRQFKLVCKDILSHRFLQITDFNKKCNSEIEDLLPKRDFFGQITFSDINYFKGIEPFFEKEFIQRILPYQKPLTDTFINNNIYDKSQGDYQYDTLHIGNILLHYLSTKGRVSKIEFNNAVYSLLEKIGKSEYDIKKIAVRLSFMLQEQGYVDYDSSNSSFCINKPHLVVIPTNVGAKFKLIGARDKLLVTSILDICPKNGLKFEIRSDENSILPQEIIFYQKKTNHELIKQLAKKFNIIFKKDDLFTQFALVSCFPDISHWSDFISVASENDSNEVEGGFLFDIESLKFVDKPKGFSKELSLIKFTNWAGYKTIYKMWYENKIYNLPDQQIGIYLYFYLYTKTNQDNLSKTKNQTGWVNAGPEMENLVKAQAKTNIFIYDYENNLLAIPLSCKLPKYFSISLQFMSDSPPVIKNLNYKDLNINRNYLIYSNISRLFFNNQIINKFCKRDLQYRYINKTIK